MSKSITLRSGSLSALSVDRELGIIRNVSIITAGEALGHDFAIDDTTVQQVADAINANPNGIPARLTHAELDGVDPIRVMAGKFRNGRREGNKTVADFHIGKYAQHSPEGNLAEYLLGLAEDAPDAVGTSIHTLDFDIEDGALRVHSLDNIDWVGSPAANPAGMLSDQTKSTSGGASPSATSALVTKGVTMNQKQIAFLQSIGLAAGANDQQVAEFVAALDNDQKTALEAAGVDAPAAPVAAAAKPVAPALALSRNDPDAINLASLEELNDLAVLSGLGGDWAMQMALERKTPAEARSLAKAAKASKRQPIPMGGSGVQVGDDLNISTLGQAMTDALCLSADSGVNPNSIPDLDGSPSRQAIFLSEENGKRVIQTHKAHDRARKFQHLSLCDKVKHYMMALGVKPEDVPTSPHTLASIALSPNVFRETMRRHGINLTQSTSDFSNLLADSMGKVLRNAYSLAAATWPKWAGRRTAKDFKTIRSVQLSEAPTLVSMPEGDEYEFGYLQDAGETTTLGSYGKGLKLTRQAVINDDTGAFMRNVAAAGRACLRLEEATAYGILTANAALDGDSVALFATAHANLVTGTLTVDNIGAAIAKMLAQTPLGGSTAQGIDVASFTLVVPTSKWVLANKIINSPVDPALNNNTTNPLGAYPIQVVHSPILEASSAIIWYLIANPAEAEFVNVWLLEGQEGPRINEEVEFTTDALMMTYGHDVTAKAVEYRHGVRSSGS